MSKKKTLYLSLSVLDMVFRVAMWVIIVYFVIKGATRCYNLGYRVFTEEPISSEGFGQQVTVEIPMDFSAKEMFQQIAAENEAKEIEEEEPEILEDAVAVPESELENVEGAEGAAETEAANP